MTLELAALFASITPDLGTIAATAPPRAGAFAVWMDRLSPLLPIPALLVILPLVWLFFRQTWRELDEDAHRHRGEALAEGKSDLRPFVAMAMAAVILTLQEYYGGRGFYEENIHPLLTKLDVRFHGKLGNGLFKFDELLGFGWWAFARIFGYVIPFPLWKLFFPRDSLLSMKGEVGNDARHSATDECSPEPVVHLSIMSSNGVTFRSVRSLLPRCRFCTPMGLLASSTIPHPFRKTSRNVVK